MIAKKYRLREHEVSRVFKKGRPFFGTYWNMNCLVDYRGRNNRMAVSISCKHDKRAVMRNRYRRGLYDGLLPVLKNPSESYSHCVFTLKKGLKLTEKILPEAWLEDARSLFEKRR